MSRKRWSHAITLSLEVESNDPSGPTALELIEAIHATTQTAKDRAALAENAEVFDSYCLDCQDQKALNINECANCLEEFKEGKV